VDSSQTITAVEWFFGYGGNHIGLKRVLPQLRLLATCEIEAYAVANMVAKMEAGLMDAAPVWTDCKTFPIESFRGLVDIFIASYPCQGFSAAGQRKGQGDPRFLWPWVIRAVAVIQPRWVFFENVEGHVSLGLNTVISDLEAAGYRVAEGIFSAAECGAPQRRKRVFILGYARGKKPRWLSSSEREAISETGRSGSAANVANGSESGRHERPSRIGECGEAMADAQSTNGRSEQPEGQQRGGRGGFAGSGKLSDTNEPGLQGRLGTELSERGSKRIAWLRSPWHWPDFVARPGEQQHEWEPPRVIETQRGLGGGTSRRASNVDRLRLLGNGVYPATAARAFVTLYNKLTHDPSPLSKPTPCHTPTANSTYCPDTAHPE
jgi:DNA (cytosine-5)-methyltransferase 1